MRIVFIGAVEFSRRSLEHLVTSGANVVGVCTLHVSTFNSDHCDLSGTCDSYGIPWTDATDINSPETVAWIAKRHPWSRGLPSGGATRESREASAHLGACSRSEAHRIDFLFHGRWGR